MTFFWASRCGSDDKEKPHRAFSPLQNSAIALAFFGLSACDELNIDIGGTGVDTSGIHSVDSKTSSSTSSGSDNSSHPSSTPSNPSDASNSSSGSQSTPLPGEESGNGMNSEADKPGKGEKDPDQPDDLDKMDEMEDPGLDMKQIDRRLRAEIRKRKLTPLAPRPKIRPALVDLGQSLAFDKILSGNRDLSCMTCHHPLFGTGDGRHLPSGIGGHGLGPKRVGGAVIPRNAPALFNLQHFPLMFWDGRVEPDQDGQLVTPAGSQLTAQMVDTFEFGVVAAQAMFPVTSGDEMRGHGSDNEIATAKDFQQVWSRLMVRLNSIKAYREAFAAAYPGVPNEDLTFAHAANAIAAFEIDAFSQVNSPWQRYLQGDNRALSKRQKRGALSFFNTGCADCHKGPMFSDFKFHNTGLAQFGPGKTKSGDDPGRELATGKAGDRYRFRTAPLINIAQTAPYGHVGQFRTLKAHVRHYRKPKKRLKRYDIRKQVCGEESSLWSTQFDNTKEVLKSIDPEVLDLKSFSVPLIVTFLQALSDPETKKLDAVVPSKVLSGLPVEY